MPDSYGTPYSGLSHTFVAYGDHFPMLALYGEMYGKSLAANALWLAVEMLDLPGGLLCSYDSEPRLGRLYLSDSHSAANA